MSFNEISRATQASRGQNLFRAVSQLRGRPRRPYTSLSCPSLSAGANRLLSLACTDVAKGTCSKLAGFRDVATDVVTVCT
jgi:hypothetical protein